MRYFGEVRFHVFIIDIQTGREKNISINPDFVDGFPGWSSDGKLLAYRHMDLLNKAEAGIYTIKPDGTGMKKIPLPPGYWYNVQISFFPGDGSSPDARIIFPAHRIDK